MRLTIIQNMFKDHEKRLKHLEEGISFIRSHIGIIQEKEEIAPIDTKKGQEQRDEAREKEFEDILKK